ncbi:hypothetical protein ACPPVS_09935 [Cellulomonas sp. McL0617]|uniref:hypothetical protein n=1 Tax=Cellulomonas sp. McL0617 TaxID=3415675 RepID=UPI003CF228D7
MSAVDESVEIDDVGQVTPAPAPWWARRRSVLAGFVALHAFFLVTLAPAILGGGVDGDLGLYRSWALGGLHHGQWPGLSVPGVYPVGALAPILAAAVAGPFFFQLVWFAMVTALNALATFVLVRGGSSTGYRAAWWWMAFLLLVYPVDLLRLEGITAPLVVVGLLLVARRPVVAGVLLSVAAWIKVWPAAVVLAVVTAHRRRWPVLGAAVAVSTGVVVAVASLGGMSHLTGFLGTQADRGLQLEAPVTTPWVWMEALGASNTYVWNNTVLSTEEVHGPGDGVAVTLMGIAMPIALALVLALIVWVLRGVGPSPELVLLGALALVTALFVFNKVGSPQYVLWIGPIVAVGIRQGPFGWRVPATVLLVIAGLTTLVFPTMYSHLVDGDLLPAVALTLRNALLVVLMGWAVARLFALRRGSVPALLHVRAGEERVEAGGGDHDLRTVDAHGQPT